MLGATALLLGLFCLTHRLLREIHPALNCLLIVPVLYMLSFSYAYGRLLVVQKEFENSMTLEVVHDIDRHVALRNLKMIYVQPSDFDLWLPGGERSMALIPALKYVRNINDYLVLPESLQRFGIVSEWLQDPDEMARLAGLQGSGPLIDRRFYAIYSAGIVVTSSSSTCNRLKGNPTSRQQALPGTGPVFFHAAFGSKLSARAICHMRE